MTATPTEAAILEAMRRRWPEDAYALITQVRNQTGYGRGNVRTADALVFGLWPSRGLTIEGVEIKRSLVDYRREAKDPAKADAFARYCDHWWICAPKGVVPVDEVPPAWGLLELSRGTLRARRRAPLQEREQMPHEMICAIMRRIQRIDEATLRSAFRDGHKKGAQEAEQFRRSEVESLRSVVEGFKEATGVDLVLNWDREAMYRAIADYRAGRRTLTLQRRIQSAAADLRRIAESIDKLADEGEQEVLT